MWRRSLPYMARNVDILVGSERLELPLIPARLLDALVADDRGAVERLAAYVVPGVFPDEEQRDFLRFRRDQLRDDPARYPWSVRAIVLRAERRMVGFVNFHGGPGGDDTGPPPAGEPGWAVVPGGQRPRPATQD